MKRDIDQNRAVWPHNKGPLTDFEVQRLFAYVRAQASMAREKGTMRPLVDEVVIELVCHAGLRPKEMCQLNLSDTPTCLKRPMIRIRSKEKHRHRMISIPKETSKILQHFVAILRPQAIPGDPLLLSERGTRFGYVSIYHKIRRMGDQAGLSGINPNRLRKTYISRLFAEQQDLRFVQQQVGHSLIKTTALYVRSAEVICDACQRGITDNHANLIDSGQLLCRQCLNELRS